MPPPRGGGTSARGPRCHCGAVALPPSPPPRRPVAARLDPRPLASSAVEEELPDEGGRRDRGVRSSGRPHCCHRQAAAGHPTVAARPHPSPARSAQRPRHFVASQRVPPQGVPDEREVQPPDHAGQGQAGEIDAGGQRVREEHPERGGTSSGMLLETKQVSKQIKKEHVLRKNLILDFTRKFAPNR